MRKNRTIFFLFILAGLSILNYPFISQWVNRRSQSRVIYEYENAAEKLTEQEKSRLLLDAEAYNRTLTEGQQVLTDGFGKEAEEDSARQVNQRYEALLNPQKDGVMCYLDLPSIDVFLPVYHGTGVDALEQGAGHLYGTSLPVGGESTHAVFAAHRGLASKALFTDLDQIKEGDVFYIHVLGEVLAYKTDQSCIVEPDETKLLEIEDGADYVTLVTCTPYGINSHRLLVRGTRIPYEETAEEVTRESSDGFWVWGKRFFIASAVILVIFGAVLLRPDKKKGGSEGGNRN